MRKDAADACAVAISGGAVVHSANKEAQDKPRLMLATGSLADFNAADEIFMSYAHSCGPE